MHCQRYTDGVVTWIDTPGIVTDSDAKTVLETVALDHSANESMEPPAGLEPAIYRLEVCRLIHWATGAILNATIIVIARSNK